MHRSQKELKLASTHFYFTSTCPYNDLVVKYSQTHITSTNSTTSTTFAGLGWAGRVSDLYIPRSASFWEVGPGGGEARGEVKRAKYILID